MLALLSRINTVRMVNEALGTTAYTLETVDDLPKDLVYACVALRMG